MDKKGITNLTLIAFLLSLHFIFIFFNYDEFFNFGNIFIIYLLVFVLCLPSDLKTIIKRGFSINQVCCVLEILYSLIIYNVMGGHRDILFAALLFFGIIFAIDGISFNSFQKNIIEKGYILSSLILSLLVIIQRYSPYSAELRYTISYGKNQYYDVNFLSTYISIPTAILFNKIVNKKVKNKFLSMSMFIILIIALLMTGSRSGIFVTIGLLFASVFFSTNSSRLKKILVVPILFFALIFAFTLLPQEIVQHLAEGIFFSEDSRRGQDWAMGTYLISKQPLFGNGMFSPHYLVNLYTKQFWLTAHNTYLTYLIFYGWIGAIPIFVILFNPLVDYIKKILKRERCEKFTFVIYVSFLLQIMVIEGGFSDIMLIPIIMYIVNNNYIQKLEMT